MKHFVIVTFIYGLVFAINLALPFLIIYSVDYIVYVKAKMAVSWTWGTMAWFYFNYALGILYITNVLYLILKKWNKVRHLADS